jgi:uncharacterized glyoxalase superfamily protein PhnB
MPAIPEGFATITPTLVVNGAEDAIALYTKAFGAKEVHRMNCPNTGKVMHACLQIGTSKLFISDAYPEKGCVASSGNFYLYLNDADSGFTQAKQAGMQEAQPLQDQFWGDRTGTLRDAFGNNWTLATHVRDVSPQELQDAVKKMASKAA